MKPISEEFLSSVVACVGVQGRAYVRFKLVDGEIVTTLVEPDEHHCVTCQCNKIHPTPPVPGNLRSKSWHENALTEKPK